MKQVKRTFTEEQLTDVANHLLKDNPNKRIFAFYGKMGVGKTTLIKALCQTLGVTDIAGSPTFSIVNQYLTEDGESIFHFDFYRMKKEEEAYDIGYEEYFFSGNYCFIEWPEKIQALLPQGCVEVSLEEHQGVREIKY